MISPCCHVRSPTPPRDRAGVLLLVVLSLLTLFMLMGVAYLGFASRIRTTSRAFLRLADEEARTSVTVKPLLRDAALQVIRGTENGRSVIRYHDLLADKYGSSQRHSVTSPGLVAYDSGKSPADGRMLQFEIDSVLGAGLTGRVLTFLDGPVDVAGRSARIIAADSKPSDPTKSLVVMLRPPRLALADVGSLTRVLVNGRDFGGTGFSPASMLLPGQASLNDSALMPNRTVVPESSFDPRNANEDYDALDEQNVALAAPDGRVRSFERPGIVDYWVREFARRAGHSSRQAAQAALLPHVWTSNLTSVPTAVRPYVLNLRRATLRPFAFDHYQYKDTTTSPPSGIDFSGKPLVPLDPSDPERLKILTATPGDVDNDGDGLLDSVWLDLGGVIYRFSDRKLVKPLFAVHCVDLGGRVNLNAHGSPLHAAATNVVGNPAFAPRREANGSKKPPTRLTTGLGFGPADVRMDGVLSGANVTAVMQGVGSASGAADGIRRDVPAIVGRYGDGVRTLPEFARPGLPNVNDRRLSRPPASWTDRDLPDDYWTSGTSRFGSGPPDMWSRLAVGIDHRGHPFYANTVPTISVRETTDNPYEFDLFAARQGGGYARDDGTPSANHDQPFTAAELEAVLRPFDVDNASALPPRALSLALAGGGNDLADLRSLATTDSWDTPAVIATDDIGLNRDLHDPDLVAGLKIDLNRPLGDALDNDADGVVDEPGETGDPYAIEFNSKLPVWKAWLLTRGDSVLKMIPQPGRDEPHLRARQLLAYHLFNLMDSLANTFAPSSTATPGLRLFAVTADTDDDSAPPLAKDPALNRSATAGDADKQKACNRRVLAQWAVNVVDFLDADAIMTPFRYEDLDTSGPQYVVWGMEHPDVLLTETLAFHDRRTADTRCDPSGETTADFRAAYKSVYDAYMAWLSGGRQTLQPPYPSVTDPDGDPADQDDRNFDQVRIPEGSLFIEIYGTRSRTAPVLPRELYSFDAARKEWFLDLGRMPTGGSAPVWRLAISMHRARDSAPVDVFQAIADHPDTEWLSPTSAPATVGGTIQIDRYVWLSGTPPTADFTASGNGPTQDNTFYLKTPGQTPRLQPGGHLVIGPRSLTTVGSIKGGAGPQKWGVPSKQSVILGSGATPVVVNDLQGNRTPTVTQNVPGRKFGGSLPPAFASGESAAVCVAMDPPASWTAWNKSWRGVGTSGIGLNASEPLRTAYYPCPTYTNTATGLVDAYGPLDDDTHRLFPTNPADEAGGPLVNKMLSGGSFANFCSVFVERLADPTKPHNANPADPGWNPYIAVDFMPVDLTVFNGESDESDPYETQGPDRQPASGALPIQVQRGGPLLPPESVPLPMSGTAQLAARHTYFHTRQRGFGRDLPDFETYGTLFGAGAVQRNLHPFKPIGSLDDVADTPFRTATVPARVDFNTKDGYRLPGGRPTTPRPPRGLDADELATFRHELGQPPANRSDADAWKQIPFHSLGWVNASFGRRLDATDGVPTDYVGAPDRPFPWVVWNDRPFANPYELIYVPRTPPGRFFTNFRNLDFPNGREPDNTRSYANADDDGYSQDDLFGAPSRGWHLLPITSITDEPGPPAVGKTSIRSRSADVFVRLFEYVRVRSPFVNAETPLAGFQGENWPARFVGPFNRVPTYREPGRINVNTIHSSGTLMRFGTPINSGTAIWNAMCGVADRSANPPPDAHPAYADILASGTIQLPFASLTSGRAVLPRPFRVATGSRGDFSNRPSGMANANFPNGLLRNPPIAGDPKTFTVAFGSSPSDIGDRFSVRSFTLLGDTPRAGTNVDRREPLFPAPEPDAWANDGQRNAWFRFESLVRANANATVRSEVYAIWVTMGWFEVEYMGGPSDFYPDGYRLVREHGSDSGDVTRHRAFYIFDRSVPVGFERGVNHNVQDAILVERFIE